MMEHNFADGIVIFIVFFTITSCLLGVGPFRTREETHPSVSYQNEASSTQHAQPADEEIHPTQSADEELSKAIDTYLFWAKIIGKVGGIFCVTIGLYTLISSITDFDRKRAVLAACLIAIGSVGLNITVLLNIL